MEMPRIRSARLVSAMLAGGVAFSAVLGPAMLPTDFGGSAARADVVVSIDLFHRELSPYGRWADDPRYGEVWYPGVREGWRPYYDDGYWVYSDEYGWLWVADQPWGWAPFHYGRWVLTDYGWAWVPGAVWGPAWVTFRSAPDYIGWAPLPPEADWDDGYGFRRHYDVVDVRCWSFVRPQGFLERRFDRYAYDRRDNRRFIQHTTNITNITIVNNRVVNRGIDVDHVERETHRHVDRFHVAAGDRPERTQLEGNKVVIYKPAITDSGRKEHVKSGSVTNGQQDESTMGVTNKKKHRDNLPAENTNQGAPAPQFVAPNGQQPTVGGNENQPLSLKKKHNNGNANLGGGSQQQLVPPDQMQPSAGGDQPQPLSLKKKRNNGNANLDGGSQQQQFVVPNQMQPSAGGDQPQPLSLKKKHNNGNANLDGGPQQPQFDYPNDGGPSAGDAQAVPQWKTKHRNNNQQFDNQPQGQQFQPQVRQQYQPPAQQTNTKHNKLNKQNTRQCQNGDAAACGSN